MTSPYPHPRQRRRSRHVSSWRFNVLCRHHHTSSSDGSPSVAVHDEVDNNQIRSKKNYMVDVLILQNAVRKVLQGAEQGLVSAGHPLEPIMGMSHWICFDKRGESKQDDFCNSSGEAEQRVKEDLGVVSELTGQIIGGKKEFLKENRMNGNMALPFGEIVQRVVMDLCELWMLKLEQGKWQTYHQEIDQGASYSRNIGVVEDLGCSCCSARRMSWNLNEAIALLGIQNNDHVLRLFNPKGAWNLNQRTLRRIVALSCASGSLVRDKIFSRCSIVLFTSILLFYRVLQLYHQENASDNILANNEPKIIIRSPTILTDGGPSSASSLESINPTPCISVPEVSSSSTQDLASHPHHYQSHTNLLSLYSTSAADLSDETLLLVLDYAFHATGLTSVAACSSPVESKTNSAQAIRAIQRGDGSHEEDDTCDFPHLFRSAFGVASGDRSIVILVSGASGCGKSTLSCLLANRLGIGTVLSTDTIRHILRSVYSRNDYPLLYASTYETGKCITSEILTENYRASVDRICSSIIESRTKEGKLDKTPARESSTDPIDGSKETPEAASDVDRAIIERRRCIEGYLQQSYMLFDRLEFIIAQLIHSGESLVVEGVHLTNDFIQRIQKRFPGRVIPFIVYLSNEDTHVDRFASRSRNFNTEPTKNKYVEYLENIRTIQLYLKQQAEMLTNDEDSRIVLIDNTSISTAIRSMHSAVVRYIIRREKRMKLPQKV